MKIYNYLQKEFHYSDFQIKVLQYFFRTIGAESSKLFVFAVFFWYTGQIQEYIFAVLVLLYFRFFGGGFHLKTYWGCFIFSFSYIFLCIQGASLISIPLILQICFLLFAILLSIWTGSIPSTLKKNISKKQKIGRAHV